MEDFSRYTADIVRQLEPFVQQAVVRVLSAARNLWPHADVHEYGSFSTGLWLPNSDVDLVVQVRERAAASALGCLHALIAQLFAATVAAAAVPRMHCDLLHATHRARRVWSRPPWWTCVRTWRGCQGKSATSPGWPTWWSLTRRACLCSSLFADKGRSSGYRWM